MQESTTMSLAPSKLPDLVPPRCGGGAQTESACDVESVWIEPPDFRPPALAVPWAPPPMLVQTVPPPPFTNAAWIGGYWIWQRRWVWAYGMWSAAPRAGLRWVHPYYEVRDGLVVFIAGHWGDTDDKAACAASTCMPAVVQAPAAAAIGASATGEPGTFVPASPGSRRGLIVPAPVGTPPAVVTGAPPMIAAGMHVQASPSGSDGALQLTVVAPAGTVVGERAVRMSVPAQAHFAASMPAVVRMLAPRPRSELSLRYVPSTPARADAKAGMSASQRASLADADAHGAARRPVWAASMRRPEGAQARA
jgi:hypothetical protein